MKRQIQLVAALTALLACSTAHADEITVSAAASLTDAFNDIGKAFSRAHPRTTVRFNFGASGALQQQIMAGAPVDLFASASPKEMDALQAANRIDRTSRVDFAGNALVLIVPARQRRGVSVRRWEDLASPAVQRFALSNPDSVPSGRYGRDTLGRHGVWPAQQAKAVLGENVRQTLAYVAGGNVDAGLVFATDAAIERGRVKVVATAVPEKDHAPIVYPAAAVTGARNSAGARQFAAFLLSRDAQGILARFGFSRAPKHRK